MLKPNRISAVLLKIAGVVVLLAGGALVALPAASAVDPRLLAWMGLILAAAACVAMWAIGSLLEREAQAPPEVRTALARVEHQVLDIQVKLKELSLTADRAARTTTSTSSAPTRDYTGQLDQLAAAIADIRELSLLPDAERRQRSHLDRQNRKLQLVNELFSMIGSREWARAERLLITLQTDFPNDDEVIKGRNYLEHSRNLVEEETIRSVKREVEELMAGAHWDRAWEKVRELVEGFPASPEARALHNRIQREHDTYSDTSAQRMFEGIRHDIDQRNWRQAFSRAQALSEQFPTHRVTHHLKAQIRTLQENAEIQERQELEVRIQELVHAGEFDEAIELAEDLIRRYPLSPQADSLEVLLPRIRELARETIGSSDALD